MITCVTCLQKEPHSDLNWRWKALGVKQKSRRDCQHGHNARFYCSHQVQEKECTRRNKKGAREEARVFVYQYIAAHPCVDCGERDPFILRGLAGEPSSIFGSPLTSRVCYRRLLSWLV